MVCLPSRAIVYVCCCSFSNGMLNLLHKLLLCLPTNIFCPAPLTFTWIGWDGLKMQWIYAAPSHTNVSKGEAPSLVIPYLIILCPLLMVQIGLQDTLALKGHCLAIYLPPKKKSLSILYLVVDADTKIFHMFLMAFQTLTPYIVFIVLVFQASSSPYFSLSTLFHDAWHSFAYLRSHFMRRLWFWFLKLVMPNSPCF